MKLLRPCFPVLLGFVSILSGLAYAPRAHAQDVPTAYKTYDVSAFGGYEFVDPAYGPDKNHGGGFGLNVTRYFRFKLEPSIEARVNLTNGTDVKERTYLVGFQAKRTFFTRYHPYADLLIGHGTIHFNTHATGYVSDDSTVVNYGGGVDIDLVHSLQFRIDYQRQYWSLGEEVNSFDPNLLLIGVHYTIPFRAYKNQRDLNP